VKADIAQTRSVLEKVYACATDKSRLAYRPGLVGQAIRVVQKSFSRLDENGTELDMGGQ